MTESEAIAVLNMIETHGSIPTAAKLKSIEALEELKHIKQWKCDIINKFCEYDCSSLDELVQEIHNKSIDDFQEWLKTQIVAIDNKTNEILVVVDDRWELATDKYKEFD